MKILVFLAGLIVGELVAILVIAILTAASYDDRFNGRE